jgi:hypothetical protein
MNSFLWVWTLINMPAKSSFLEGLRCENLVVKLCTHWKSKMLSPEEKKIWTSRTLSHYPVSYTILVVCSNDSSCLSYTKHNCLLCLWGCFVSLFNFLVMSVHKTEMWSEEISHAIHQVRSWSVKIVWCIMSAQWIIHLRTWEYVWKLIYMLCLKAGGGHFYQLL